MLRKLLVFVFALGALNAAAYTTSDIDPINDYIASEIEKLELENELFGDFTNDEDIISIASIELKEIDENIELNFNSSDYLPVGFDAKKGMNDIDWNTIELYEIEEEVDLNNNSLNQLKKNIIPSKGMDCDSFTVVDFKN